MYQPKAHRVDDAQVVHTFLRSARSANLITILDGVPVATRLPTLFDNSGPVPVVRGHLAAGNPQSKSAGSTAEALLIFDGPEAYVSPSNYAEKHVSGKVVPTWDYVTCHVTGELRFIRDFEPLRQIISDLTDRHEGMRATPWAVSDAPEEHIAKLAKAIVGIEVVASKIEMKAKLSADKPAEDRRRLIDDLRTGSIEDQAIADLIEAAL